ncbi:MAG: hypothetical protein EZS28_024386 [Streblomastix strix]|uniref:Uncharacterized protein n=1 Tax=Streblomastix strix TaxID=222440 RepID=A0A5J4VCD2_9EUKA|nr:MAG: hypothetical protein EZS28_024386 [Streblomastix strix]
MDTLSNTFDRKLPQQNQGRISTVGHHYYSSLDLPVLVQSIQRTNGQTAGNWSTQRCSNTRRNHKETRLDVTSWQTYCVTNLSKPLSGEGCHRLCLSSLGYTAQTIQYVIESWKTKQRRHTYGLRRLSEYLASIKLSLVELIQSKMPHVVIANWLSYLENKGLSHHAIKDVRTSSSLLFDKTVIKLEQGLISSIIRKHYRESVKKQKEEAL